MDDDDDDDIDDKGDDDDLSLLVVAVVEGLEVRTKHTTALGNTVYRHVHRRMYRFVHTCITALMNPAREGEMKKNKRGMMVVDKPEGQWTQRPSKEMGHTGHGPCGTWAIWDMGHEGHGPYGP